VTIAPPARLRPRRNCSTGCCATGDKVHLETNGLTSAQRRGSNAPRESDSDSPAYDRRRLVDVTKIGKVIERPAQQRSAKSHRFILLRMRPMPCRMFSTIVLG